MERRGSHSSVSLSIQHRAWSHRECSKQANDPGALVSMGRASNVPHVSSHLGFHHAGRQEYRIGSPAVLTFHSQQNGAHVGQKVQEEGQEERPSRFILFSFSFLERI